MTRVIGYVRVSTMEQAAGGLSLAAQESAIRAYCEMRGLELVEILSDPAVSAGKPLERRPSGSRLVAAARRPEIVAVITHKLDRLFRDVEDCLRTVRCWDAENVALHLVDMGGQTIDTSTAMGRFFLTVIAGAAELERNLVAERTSMALRQARAEGAHLGREGLGWVRTDQLDQHGRRVVVPVEGESETVARLRELKAQGLSLRAVAQQLTAEGRQTKRGGRWHASTVRSVLKRAA